MCTASQLPHARTSTFTYHLRSISQMNCRVGLVPADDESVTCLCNCLKLISVAAFVERLVFRFHYVVFRWCAP